MQIPQKLTIKQKVEWVEVFTNFETKNKYKVIDENKREIFYAREQSNFLGRQFLKAARPLEIHITDTSQQDLLVMKRPFYWFNAKHALTDAAGKTLGSIKQTAWFVNKRFEVYDHRDQLKYTCESKFPHIWTFNILQNDNQVGQILKKWAGIGREAFTDADKFTVDFGSTSDHDSKLLLLATAFAIDLRCFEK